MARHLEKGLESLYFLTTERQVLWTTKFWVGLLWKMLQISKFFHSILIPKMHQLLLFSKALSLKLGKEKGSTIQILIRGTGRCYMSLFTESKNIYIQDKLGKLGHGLDSSSNTSNPKRCQKVYRNYIGVWW